MLLSTFTILCLLVASSVANKASDAKEAFRAVDYEHDGKLSLEDFQDYYTGGMDDNEARRVKKAMIAAFEEYDDDESGELSLREFTRHAAARELKEFLAMEPVDSYSSGEEQEENFDDEESSEVQNEKIYSREANEDAAVLSDSDARVSRAIGETEQGHQGLRAPVGDEVVRYDFIDDASHNPVFNGDLFARRLRHL